MGFIRKSLAVTTLGVVNGSSKKQRVAKASLNVQRDILHALNGATAAAQPEVVSGREYRRRLATDPAFAAAVAARDASKEQARRDRLAAAGHDPRYIWER